MKPTEFFLDYAYLRDKYEENTKIYRKHNPDKDYAVEFFNITDAFLGDDKLNYLKFGCYWWAVKSIMRKQGFTGYSGIAEPAIQAAYLVRNPDTGDVDEHATLTAAWEFKDHYNATYFQGNREFEIFENGEIWTLSDPSWERNWWVFGEEVDNEEDEESWY